jgi:hypothetical protein
MRFVKLCGKIIIMLIQHFLFVYISDVKKSSLIFIGFGPLTSFSNFLYLLTEIYSFPLFHITTEQFE